MAKKNTGSLRYQDGIDRRAGRKARKKYWAEYPDDTPEKSRLRYKRLALAKAARKLYRLTPAGREAARHASQAYRDRQVEEQRQKGKQCQENPCHSTSENGDEQ